MLNTKPFFADAIFELHPKGCGGFIFADPTAGQSAIIVEVDYFMPAMGPDSDAINLPYPYTAESVDL